MMVSSFYTVSYLQRHVRSVAQGDGCFSALRIQSQMRVTRTGISQAVLYLLFATFYVIDSFTHIFSPHFFLSAWISFTVTSLYISGTTVNLGIDNTSTSRLASYVVFVWSLSTSMNSTVWLNYFYYTQIVPAQRALFIWIKKNIKPIIYCIWLVERIYSFFEVGIMLMDYLILTDRTFDGVSYNFTMYHVPILSSNLWTDLYVIALCIVGAHFVMCLCVMVMSSGSTVVYLCRHMRRMVANGQPLPCPRFRAQVRVTVIGILQGVLYVFCAVWTMYKCVSQHTFMLSLSMYSQFSVTHLYMSGTTFNLGVGQAVFRQRVADIWLRAAQWCKANKVQQSEH
ncbi:taste receptor, type 2, member 201, tandem duplicate 1 [Enoplosus armatus]|uniref:taste receptor, type 2, member 201, tandem duplicate 1 n=1 Tax=Enoplosus armatus TaxID=215367 RepID=UPI0039941715